MLVAIRFTHYSPKDIEEGIKEYVISDSINNVLEYINKEYRWNDLFDDGEEKTEICPDEQWWHSHPNKKVEAKAMGITIDEFGYATGPRKQIMLWWGGEDFGEVSDAYYGVTHYDWRDQQEISAEDAYTLVKLNIAKIV